MIIKACTILDNGTEHGVRGETVLAAIEEARVFCVLPEQGQFVIEEACDHAFHVRLTRTQLIALANDLLLLALAKDPQQEQ